MSAADRSETYGQSIRRRREDLRLTQQQLADKAELSKRTVRNVEADDPRVTRRSLTRIEQALLVPPAERAWIRPDMGAAEKLRAAAAGRREYAASGGLDHQVEALHIEACALDRAADLVDGDDSPLYGWLPSWRWSQEMEDALYGRGSS